MEMYQQEEHSKEAQLRRLQLQAIRAQTRDAFPNHFKPSHTSSSARALWEKNAEMQEPIQLAGRVMAKRIMGRAIFLNLQDGTGSLQLYANKSNPTSTQQTTIEKLNIGDIIGVSGTLFLTKTQALTLKLDKVELLTKAIRPLPEKYHGLTDTEQRYRQRYLDLIMNAEVKERFKQRSKIVSRLRTALESEEFLEVETPMLQPLSGGANARPFQTHHNALNSPFYLRIAPELFLKRLLVGGFDKVFEINRNFRNEGLSTRHNPEFTMCEFYATYWNYLDLMVFIERLIKELCQSTLGTLIWEKEAIRFDLSKPFEKYSLVDSLQRQFPSQTIEDFYDPVFLSKTCELAGISCLDQSIPLLQYALFEHLVEPTLIQPTFITHYPSEVSPLSRRCVDKPEFSERFELFVDGRELANGFSELNDPEEQAACFQAQMLAKSKGNEECMPYDTDYIAALEHGMPPAAGAGIGIDRLVMWLTGCHSIKDVILFPTLKPLTSENL